MSQGIFLAIKPTEAKGIARAAKLANVSRTHLVRTLVAHYLAGGPVNGLPRLVRTRTAGGRLRLEADTHGVGSDGEDHTE